MDIKEREQIWNALGKLEARGECAIDHWEMGWLGRQRHCIRWVDR
jgi:hypothetical protein